MSSCGRGLLSQLLMLLASSGKTVVNSDLTRRMSARVLVLVHREELAWQAAEKSAIAWPETGIGLVKAELDELGRQDDGSLRADPGSSTAVGQAGGI